MNTMYQPFLCFSEGVKYLATLNHFQLVAGLAFGILLLSEVLYLKSFDSFYPEANRVFCRFRRILNPISQWIKWKPFHG